MTAINFNFFHFTAKFFKKLFSDNLKFCGILFRFPGLDTTTTFHTCVTAFMFDLKYTAVILQNVLIVTKNMY